LREMRQNPTEAIDAVEGGEAVVITRHGRPIADLVPHRARPGATPREFAELLDRSSADPEWERELAHQRAEETRDLWGNTQ